MMFFFFVNILHRWLIKPALENTCGTFVINADVLRWDCEAYNSICADISNLEGIVILS